MPGDLNSQVNVSTKRTTINIAAVTAVIGSAAYVSDTVFHKKLPDLDIKMLAPLAPVIGFVYGVGYRLSRAIVARFPQVGWILFGSQKTPVNVPTPDPPKE